MSIFERTRERKDLADERGNFGEMVALAVGLGRIETNDPTRPPRLRRSSIVNLNNHHKDSSTRSSMRASAQELGQFLHSMKGKGPRAVLSALTQSKLGWAMIQATVGTLALMAILTVGPYLYSKNSTPSESKETAQEQETKEKADTAKQDPKVDLTKTGDKPADKPAGTVADNKKDKTPPSKDIVDKLGENTTKTGVPDIDKLLDK